MVGSGIFIGNVSATATTATATTAATVILKASATWHILRIAKNPVVVVERYPLRVVGQMATCRNVELKRFGITDKHLRANWTKR